MGPFLDHYKLPKTLDELKREQNEINELIRKQKNKLKEALNHKKKNINNFYVFESTIDNRDSKVNKHISEIELELYKLNFIRNLLEIKISSKSDATKQVKSFGTSPEEMTPWRSVSPKESGLRSILKSVGKFITNRRSASKPKVGGRKTRRQRARRAH